MQVTRRRDPRWQVLFSCKVWQLGSRPLRGSKTQSRLQFGKAAGRDSLPFACFEIRDLHSFLEPTVWVQAHLTVDRLIGIQFRPGALDKEFSKAWWVPG